MNKQLKADIMLIIVTLCWGVSYYYMDLSLTDLGPFTLNAHRFLGGFLIAALFAFKKIKSVNKTTMFYSFIIGSLLVFVYSGATFGVKYTTLSNSGFLCALTVIFVPIISFLFLHKKPEKKIVISIAMSMAGIMLLTLKDDFSINAENLKGDIFCTLGALGYAVDLLVTEHAVKKEEVNAFQLGVFQLMFTGIYMLVLGFIFEEPHLPSTPEITFYVFVLAVFCTGVAFIVQVVAQQYTPATHVGIIFTLEPVFAGIVAYVFAHEVMTFKSYLGAAIMVAALFLTEIDFRALREKHRKNTDKQSLSD